MKLEKNVSVTTINKNLLNVNYAVRGPILERAMQIERELEKGVPKPFDRVVRANIGDCHALGQKPITFIRQVLALMACPQLVSSPDFPEDVKRRVKEILDDCTKQSVGSYSPSAGLQVVRKAVASYLTSRDMVLARPDDIYLGNGATDLIKAVLTMFAGHSNGKPSAVMIPIPQYPLFSGALSELGIHQAHYYLDEENGWALDIKELERSWHQSSMDSHVSALVIINPGNPTGQVLTRENMEEIVKFAYSRGLFLLADEVYQENIVSKPFHSFKKVIHQMGEPYSSMALASFVTCSKGWAAECGLRAGFLELIGLEREVLAAFSRTRAIRQCPGVLGQCALHCIVQPPKLGEASYPLFAAEKLAIERTLADRTTSTYIALNAIPGYFCNPIDGSMFAFPRVEIPVRAQIEAREMSLTPDEFYCLRLLEETGICVVPGTGFGQQKGTFHFRTTILHPHHEFKYMMESISRFHLCFLERYTSPEVHTVQNVFADL